MVKTDTGLAFFKKEIAEERLVVLDFEYMASFIEKWWAACPGTANIQKLKAELTNLIFKHIKDSDFDYFSNLGFQHGKIAAVCIKNIFKTDSSQLSLVVHDVFSDLFYLTDVKYDYEDHKTLYLKPAGENYRDWGNGYGEITPHSDDLYEDLNVDYLALTVCRDATKTPTACFFPKDILHDFTDDELLSVLKLKANFKSGKNVSILKARSRNIVEYSEPFGFRFFMDFRVDNVTGERMQAIEKSDQLLLDKLRSAVQSCSCQLSSPETGTFLIVANHKVLHARSQMNIDKDLAQHYGYNASFVDTPRLLFRSKGPRKELSF